MPALAILPVIAAAAPVVAGTAALTVGTALALGATVVGAGLAIAGEVTGSGLLKKIGFGFSAAGSIGGALSSAGAFGSNTTKNNSVGGITSADVAEVESLQADTSTEGLLKSKTVGAKDVLSSNPLSRQGRDAVGSFENTNTDINLEPAGAEQSIFEKFNTQLEKYNTAINIAGGIGDAYMENQRYETQEDIARKNREFQQFNLDRDYNATSGNAVARGVSLNPAVRGLLRNGAA